MKRTIGIFYVLFMTMVCVAGANAAPRTEMFDAALSEVSGPQTDTSTDERAERIRRQRALLDAAGNQTNSAETGGANTASSNACDTALRKCMSEKCGADFTKCATDSTTIWNDKTESCRRKTKCTGHEYAILAPEILADRDANVRLSYYNSVISCGNKYNNCIFTECGTTLDKCLAKSAGDKAVSKCASIANGCKEQDSGLAARAMSVFGDLRKLATARVQKDEKRLYELRDLMRDQCNRLGAIFDERTLDCVYTVNFFAGDDAKTPKASKKLYAGDSFQCNANWFGIDVTTFKENAYRLTRSQKSASTAMLGAGIGTAAGLLTSGAIDRALNTQKAEKAAKEECKSDATKKWKGGECVDKTAEEIERDNNQGRNNRRGGNDNHNCGTKVWDPETEQCVDKNDEVGDFVRPDAKGTKPTETELNEENGEQRCREYYTDEYCDEYYGINTAKSVSPTSSSTGATEKKDDIDPNTKDPEKESSVVDINITPLTSANTPIQGSLSCKYKNKDTKTTKQGNLLLKKIPGNTECTITSKVPTCSPLKKTAKELSSMQSVTMQCQNVDDCLAKSNKWENNQCIGNNDFIPLFKLQVGATDSEIPASQLARHELAIKCDSNTGTAEINNFNVISIAKMLPGTKCTISAKKCKPQTHTVSDLKKTADNNQEVKLECPELTDCMKLAASVGGEYKGFCIDENITITWAEASKKFLDNSGEPLIIENITCGQQVLSATNKTITARYNTMCKVSFDGLKVDYELSKMKMNSSVNIDTSNTSKKKMKI
ncbi:MAG: hypothetical protein J6T57_02590 [Alphaproteobacteria bacterium]|nr:hypothetical protein [Alphaproteobacteria bacterium]